MKNRKTMQNCICDDETKTSSYICFKCKKSFEGVMLHFYRKLACEVHGPPNNVGVMCKDQVPKLCDECSKEYKVVYKEVTSDTPAKGRELTLDDCIIGKYILMSKS